MIRRIVLAALFSTLAVSGLALGGDHVSKTADRCDASSCPIPCSSCPLPCSGDGGSCSMSR